MDFFDVLLTIVYLGICLGIGYAIKKRNKSNSLYQKWFIKGLAAKLVGCIGFCLVYTYYYDYGGDTKGYFRDATQVIQSIQYGFDVFFQVFSRKYDNVSFDTLNSLANLTYHAVMEYYTVNLSIPFILLGLGSYFSASLLIATFSYWGVWRLFQLFIEKYPAIEKELAFSILFIPSVVFWGSGLNKDTFIICFLGLFLYHANKIFMGKAFHLNHLLILGVSAFLSYKIKSYVMLSLVPAVVLWRTLYLRDRIKNALIRSLTLPFFGAMGMAAIVWSVSLLSQYDQRYSIDNFIGSAQSMQGWHYVEGENTSVEYGRGSSYSLGEYDPSPWGVSKMLPTAVNVTFFRPYLWEVNGAAMLAQSVESLLFLIFTILTIFKVGPWRFYSIVSRDSFIVMCLVFALFFGFAVGFSAYNFGALSRYKIPCIPFYLAALFIIRNNYLLANQPQFRSSSFRKPSHSTMVRSV